MRFFKEQADLTSRGLATQIEGNEASNLVNTLRQISEQMTPNPTLAQ